MNYIYLHGFCSGPSSYKGNFLRLKMQERGHVLLTPDLNDGDFEHLTVTSQLNVIRRLCESIQGDITLIGSSLGAYMAGLFAREEPRVKAMVLMASAFGFLSRRAEQMGAAGLKAWRENGVISVHHHEYKEERPLHYGILDDARKYEAADLGTSMPVLLIHGIEDETVPWQLSLDYALANPAAELVLLHADHQLTGVQDKLWEHTRSFLKL